MIDPEAHRQLIIEDKDELLRDCYAWIFDDSSFDQWQTDQTCRLLWIKGDTGKGKTMLMIALIDRLADTKPGSTTIPPVYFFCQSTVDTIRSATAVLRGLLWQLLSQHSRLGEDLYKKFNDTGKQLFQGTNAFFEVASALSQILNDPELEEVNILVDALDECDVDKEKLLDFLARETSKSNSKAKWIVSSRNHADIGQYLERSQQKSVLSLELNASHVALAVEAYIDHKTLALAREKKYNKELESQVKHELKAKADATFLWAALVLKELGRPSAKSRKALSTVKALPSTLNALYTRMFDQLERQDEDDREMCMNILRCVAVAHRPLQLSELAVLADLDEDVADSENDIIELIECCGSFIDIRRETCHFVHQSAKDFLMAGGAHQSLFAEGVARAHVRLVQLSLNTLFANFGEEHTWSTSMLGRPPMTTEEVSSSTLKRIGYACCFWADHVIDVFENGHRQDSWVRAYLSEGGPAYEFLSAYVLRWIETLADLRSLDRGMSAIEKLEIVAEVSQVLCRSVCKVFLTSAEFHSRQLCSLKNPYRHPTYRCAISNMHRTCSASDLCFRFSVYTEE